MIYLPETFYGFVVNGKETKHKNMYADVGDNIFIALDSSIGEDAIAEFKKLNESVLFKFIHVGWINDQFTSNRCTLQFRVERIICAS